MSIVEMLLRGREMFKYTSGIFNDSLCVKLKGDFDRC